jgi:hypothetical protein
VDIIEIIGYASALLIGLSLGLTGAGGSILTVPILVYLMGIETILSTGYSLFIVGLTAAVGAIRNALQKQVDYSTAIVFGISSMSVVFVMRKYIMFLIPEDLLNIGGITISKSFLVLIVFASLMLVSSFKMIGWWKQKIDESAISVNHFRILLQGILVGLLAGFVGAGGGFLIVPALVLLAGLPMKKAIGTSLFIIAANSLFGFLGDISERTIDWNFLLVFSSIAITGIFIGMAFAKKVSAASLKKGFGYFVLMVGTSVIISELAKLF